MILELSKHCIHFFQAFLNCNRANFWDIMGFGASNLFPGFVWGFVHVAMELLHYEGNTNYLHPAFVDASRMGSHTDVFVLQPRKNRLLHFLWSHPGQRPFGFPLSIFCTKCWVYRPWASPHIGGDGDTITLCCQACGYINKYRRPENRKRWTSLGGTKNHNTGPQGEWFVEENNLSSL